MNPDCEELDVSGNLLTKPHSSSKTHVTKMPLRAGAGIHTAPARATVSYRRYSTDYSHCPGGAANVYVCAGPDGALVAKLAHCRLRSVAVSSWWVAGDGIVGNDRVLRCGGSLQVRSIVSFLARVVVSRVVAAATVPRVDPACARSAAVAAAWDAAVWCARVADGAAASVARCASARDAGAAASPAVVLSRQQKKHVKRRDRRDAAREKSLLAEERQHQRWAELAVSKWAARIAEQAALSAEANVDEALRVVDELHFWRYRWFRTPASADEEGPYFEWEADLALRRLAAHLSNRAHAMRGSSSPVDDDEEYEDLSGLGFRSWTHPSDAGCY